MKTRVKDLRGRRRSDDALMREQIEVESKSRLTRDVMFVIVYSDGSYSAWKNGCLWSHGATWSGKVEACKKRPCRCISSRMHEEDE